MDVIFAFVPGCAQTLLEARQRFQSQKNELQEGKICYQLIFPPTSLHSIMSDSWILPGQDLAVLLARFFLEVVCHCLLPRAEKEGLA